MHHKHKTDRTTAPTTVPKNSEQLSPREVPEHLQTSIAEFAYHLDTARILWRRYTELVEAPEFPKEFLASFYEKSEGAEPGTESLYDDELVQAGLLRLTQPLEGRA